MPVQEHLGDSVSRLRAVLDSLQEGVVTADASGNILDWNPSALALHGFGSAAEAYAQLADLPELFELLSMKREPLSLDEWPMSRVLRGETFSAWELYVRRKDTGAEKVFSYSGTSVLEDGRLVMAVVTLQDVTERVKAEATLKAREAELTDFVENATVGLHWVDGKGLIKWANKTELDMLGYSREEYIGRPIADFHADEAVINDILSTLIQGDSLHDREAKLRCKDGSIRTVLINSNVLFEGDRFVHTRCFTRDITDIKLAEEQTQKIAERFSALADNIDQLAWMADADGWIYWYNRRWYEYTGKTPEQMEGWGWQSVHDPEILSAVMERWKASIASGAPFSMEFPIRESKGRYRPFLTRVQPLREASGQIGGWFGTNTDISEQKQAQVELQRLSQSLEELVVQRTEELLQANEQLQGFTYSVAHDFRQHIRGININASLLLEEAGAALSDQGRDKLHRLVTSAKNIAALTDDLLRYAKLGKMDLKVTEVDLSAIVEQIGSTIQEKPYCSIATRFVVEPAVFAKADPGLIRLALENLIDNACKYSQKEDGPVVEFGRDSISYFVRDNGVGIDMKYAHKLFEPFERLDQKGYEGTGIGLANVKRIIERHSGRVWAESAPGEGATLRFTLS